MIPYLINLLIVFFLQSNHRQRFCGKPNSWKLSKRGLRQLQSLCVQRFWWGLIIINRRQRPFLSSSFQSAIWRHSGHFGAICHIRYFCHGISATTRTLVPRRGRNTRIGKISNQWPWWQFSHFTYRIGRQCRWSVAPVHVQRNQRNRWSEN